MGQRSLACGTLRVPREHGARGKVLNQGMLWNVSWSQNPPWRCFFIWERVWSRTLFISWQSKGRLWVRYSHTYGILVTKITLEMLFHLGTVLVPYFLFLGSLMPGFCHQLTFQSIPWFKTFPLAPCSRGTRRVPQARLRWPIQSITLDTYHILFHGSPNAWFESYLAIVTVY